MSRSTSPLITLVVAQALVGCGSSDDGLPDSPAEPLAGADAVVSVAIDDAVGGAPLRTWVRALNVYGAAIPSEPIAVTVDGEPVDVTFDGTGYGVLRVDAPGVVGAASQTDDATLVALDADWPGFGAGRAAAAAVPDAERVVAISTGAVVAKGTELWWAAPDGRSHRVLNADAPIAGLRAVHVDVDEYLDVVAWSEFSVFLLRARGPGGLSWGGGFTAPGFTVGGADVGDLDDDSLPDLAIAWGSGDGSKLDVWSGDGLFRFTPDVPRNLPDIPVDLSIGDNTGEGRNQVTVLHAGGGWSRYIAGTETQYMPVGPLAPQEIVVGQGSTLDADGDVNGDRADELWLYGPRTPGSPRDVYVVDLTGQHIRFVPWQPEAAHLARGDGDGDEVIDLFAALGDGDLNSLSYDFTTANSYTPRRLLTLPEAAPIALRDWIDGDEVVDLFLAGASAWRWWRGGNDPEDPERFWWIDEPALETVGASAGLASFGDLDGDPDTVDIVAFETDGNTKLVVYQWEPGDAAPARRDDVVISSDALAPIDLAVCDGFAWVLMSGELARVNLKNPAAISKTGGISTLASRVACGDGPEKASGALLTDGTVQLLGTGLAELATLSAPGAVDLAMGDPGAGPEVATCDEAGCTVAFWPWGADGEGGFVVAAGGTIGWADGPGVAGSGEMSFHDVDADGFLDLLAASGDGVVTIVRSPDAAVAEHHHFLAPLRGAVGAGDADGDGHADVWLLDDAGALRHSVAPWVPSDPAPGDTGTPPTGSGP